MDFEFTAVRPPSMVADENKEPQDKGIGGHEEEALKGKDSEKPVFVSFRDKILGKHAAQPREKTDLVAKKLVQIEHVNGNRLMPMLRVEKKLIEELRLPWRDALVVKI